MLEDAREGILRLLGAKTGSIDADRLIFTSGGTEANNLALLGLSGGSGDCIVVSIIEHPSVVTAAAELKGRGRHIEILPVNELGQVFLRTTAAHGRLSAMMLANNETGVIQSVAELARSFRDCGTLIHTDAVQAVGKIPVSFRELSVDAMSVAPHKFHGPMGIGALVVRHGVKLQPQLFGGFQQGGQRPGTENVALAVGFHTALKLAVEELCDRAARMQSLRDQLENELREFGRRDACPTVIVGEQAPRLPNTSCVSFPGLDRQALVMALDLAGVACSTGSACASGSSEPSPTLVAMGLPKPVIDGAIRLSLGACTTAEEVAEAARRIIKTVKHLRSQK
jgi:cysteine desulfurase